MQLYAARPRLPDGDCVFISGKLIIPHSYNLTRCSKGRRGVKAIRYRSASPLYGTLTP